MLHDMPASNETYSRSRSSTRKKPFLFFSNILKRKKILELDDIMFDKEMNHRARSEPSVVSYRCNNISISQHQHSPSASTLSLTPGRCRDLDQDMQALRLSRQDNPFIQKVIASRESLIDSAEEIVSDDAILMSQDFNADNDTDPFTLPEVHEHMIRSPPPTSWPRSPRFSIFNFPEESNQTISSQSSEESTKSAIYFNHQPKLREIFSSSQSVIDTSNNNNNNNNNNTQHQKSKFLGHTVALPRPHSSHHCESPRNALQRPYSQCEAGLGVKHYK